MNEAGKQSQLIWYRTIVLLEKKTIYTKEEYSIKITIFKKFSIITVVQYFIKNVSMCIIIYEIVSYEIDCQILKFVFAAVKFNENALHKSVFKKNISF